MNSELKADFTSHHIEGIAREGNKPFSVPLITQVDESLWQGGCIHGVSLGGKFKHVISLYPWEQYIAGGELDSVMMVRLFDSCDMPPTRKLYAIARWINVCRKEGLTLVHCQAGLNRSALVTALALKLSGMKMKDAIALLRAQRSPAVLCNQAFENWLLKHKVQP
jgi:hypothetical protein